MTTKYNMVESNVVCGYCLAKVVDVTARHSMCPICGHYVDEYMAGSDLAVVE